LERPSTVVIEWSGAWRTGGWALCTRSFTSKPNAVERTYFPYNTVYRQAFRIRFPHTKASGTPTISPDATWVGLRFAGAQGNSELVWSLKESPKPAPDSPLGIPTMLATQ